MMDLVSHAGVSIYAAYDNWFENSWERQVEM